MRYCRTIVWCSVAAARMLTGSPLGRDMRCVLCILRTEHDLVWRRSGLGVDLRVSEWIIQAIATGPDLSFWMRLSKMTPRARRMIESLVHCLQRLR